MEQYEFYQIVDRLRQNDTNKVCRYRLGQLVFNAMAQLTSDVGKPEYRHLDPYFDDSKVEAFVEFHLNRLNAGDS